MLFLQARGLGPGVVPGRLGAKVLVFPSEELRLLTLGSCFGFSVFIFEKKGLEPKKMFRVRIFWTLTIFHVF